MFYKATTPYKYCGYNKIKVMLSLNFFVVTSDEIILVA